MIFLQLFYVFSKIGIFNFGGGYAMLSLIQDEVVNKHHWMTVNEFTDIVAISQSTPGPIGINCATYTGYTAVIHAGFPTWAAVLGAVLAADGKHQQVPAEAQQVKGNQQHICLPSPCNRGTHSGGGHHAHVERKFRRCKRVALRFLCQHYHLHSVICRNKAL